MQAVAELTSILHEVLLLNKSRINFIAEFILALIKVRTVNLVEIAQAFSGSTKLSSKYRRIQRFFQDCSICNQLLVYAVAAFFPPGDKGWLLSIDRTNWNFGRFKINIMMLSITFKDASLPLFFTLLPKQGSSSEQERIDFMKKFISIVPTSKITSLLGDREFVGQLWFDWLNTNDINFTIRVKNNHIVTNHKGKRFRVKKLFYKSSNTARFLKHKINISGVQLYISGMRLPDNIWLIVVTNHDHNDSLARYKLRWGIECLFRHLKTKGFNLESTHINSTEKIETLVGLITLTVIWLHKIGETIVIEEPINIKTHGRKEKSIFRVGIDMMRTALLNIDSNFKQLTRYFNIFYESILRMFDEGILTT